MSPSKNHTKYEQTDFLKILFVVTIIFVCRRNIGESKNVEN